MIRPIACLFVGILCSVSNHLLAQQFVNSVTWEPTPRAAALKAAKESKLVLLHFTASWCRPCQEQKRFVFSSPQVARAIHEHTVPVLVDVDQNQRLAEELGIKSVPFDVFLTPDGEVVSERKSPKNASNFITMCQSNGRQFKSVAKQPANHLAEFKKQISPQSVDLNQRSEPFRVTGPPQATIESSRETSELVNRSLHADKIVGRYHQPRTPRNEIERALQELAQSQEQIHTQKKNGFHPKSEGKSQFFDIAEKRSENPFQSYDPVTNEYRPNADFEQEQRTEFLKRRRENIKVLQQPIAPQPVRIVNDQFFRQLSHVKSETSQPIKGVEVSEMVDARSGRRLGQHPGDKTIARFKHPDRPEPAVLSNAARIIRNEIPTQPSSLTAAPNTARATIKSRSKNRPTGRIAANVPNHGSRHGVQPTSATQPLDSDTDPGSFDSASFDTDSFGLHGKCPIALIKEGKWIDGDPRWGITHRDRTYLFSSKAALDLFRQSPDRYSPVLSGFDPVVFHETGELVDGLESNGVFMGQNGRQQIVLFTSTETQSRFRANPKLYMSTVNDMLRAANSRVARRVE